MGNLSTPERVQKLQSALQTKAKEQSDFRFYLLYDKLYRADILSHAYACCRSNGGADGSGGCRYYRGPIEPHAAGLGGVRFLGTTLWIDFRLYGEGEAWSSRRKAKALIEDFRAIRNGGRLFTPEDSVSIHESSKAWLTTELDKAFDGSTVVVTHHLPATPSIASQYRNDPLNPAFARRLEDAIEKYRPELWVHGHTHVPRDYEIFNTRVVCNPRGYPSEMAARGFASGLIVEV